MSNTKRSERRLKLTALLNTKYNGICKEAGMAQATVTSKGQVTIPKEIREQLGIHVGDRLLFTLTGNGIVTMEVDSEERLTRMFGMLRHLKKRRPVSVKEMDEAVKRRAKRRFATTRAKR
jgi:AbrB family looped-hinge helix DNA binding protein